MPRIAGIKSHSVSANSSTLILAGSTHIAEHFAYHLEGILSENMQLSTATLASHTQECVRKVPRRRGGTGQDACQAAVPVLRAIKCCASMTS